MRKFKLINGNGAEFDLNSPFHFLQNPDGLGLAREITSAQAGYDFIEVKNEPVQKMPSGEIAFKRQTAYAKYQEFVRFCAVPPLVLCYMPLSKWHYIDVELQSIGKGELDRTARRLICPVSFLGLSTWYEAKKSYEVQSSEAEGKIYPYTYPYTYRETAAGNKEINNTGFEASPCIIHIFGEVVNPSWSLLVDGVSVLTGGVDVTIPAGNKLVVNSSPKDMEIAEYSADGEYVADRYQNSDFSKARFIMAPPGRSVLSFTHEGAGEISVVVEVKQLADSV